MLIVLGVLTAVVGGTGWALWTLRAHREIAIEGERFHRFEPVAQDATGAVEGVLEDGRAVLVRGYESPNLAPWRTERLPEARWGLAAQEGEEWWCIVTDDTVDPVVAAHKKWEPGLGG